MSLRDAVADVAAAMEEEAVARVLSSDAGRMLDTFARMLRLALKAAGDDPPPRQAYGGISAAEQHRNEIEKARQQLRREKELGEGQAELDGRMVSCVGGPADGVLTKIPCEPPAGGSRYCFVAGARYRLRDDGKELIYDPPAGGAGKVLLP